MNKLNHERSSLTALEVGDEVWLGPAAYEVFRVASGGMGLVLLLTKKGSAFKTDGFLYRLGMAVKTVLPDELSDESLALFRRELTVWAGFTHPHVVELHEILDAGNGNWVATMNRYDGSVADLLHKSGKLSLEDASHVMRNVVSGLKYAFDAHKVLHLDIKPGNILYTVPLPSASDKHNRYLVSDWGLASIKQPELHKIAGLPPTHPFAAQTFNRVGTLLYMAPERFREGVKSSVATDIFSLGMLYFQMVIGCLPYTDEAHPVAQLITGHYYQRINSMLSEFAAPQKFKQTLLRMLAPAPQDRYSNYAELTNDIAKIARSGQPVWKRIFS